MRRFEFVGGSSAKFWMAKVEGNTFTIVFGRLGTDGQRKEKEFDDEEEAEAELEKKINEKLKEGYVEVASDAAAAPPPGKKGAEAASAKLTLPPRFTSTASSGTGPAPAMVKAATTVLKSLAKATTQRSWRRQVAAKEARRALHRIRGVDLDAHKDLGDAFDAVLDAVVSAGASAGKPGLPLAFVIDLLNELPVEAFGRALSRWKKPLASGQGGPSAQAIAALQAVHETLGDDELALRVGGALCDRDIVDAAAAARFARVRSFAEAAAAKSGGLKKWLNAVDDHGDVVCARRKVLFAA